MPEYLGKCKSIIDCNCHSVQSKRGDIIDLWKISYEETCVGFKEGIYDHHFSKEEDGIIISNRHNVHGLIGRHFDKYFVVYKSPFEILLKKAKEIRRLGNKIINDKITSK